MKFIVCGILFTGMFFGTICVMQPELLQFAAKNPDSPPMPASASATELDTEQAAPNNTDSISEKTKLNTEKRQKKRSHNDDAMDDFMQSVYSGEFSSGSDASTDRQSRRPEGRRNYDAPAGAPEGMIDAKKNPPRLQVSGWKNSSALNIGSLKGKIVVIDFWATWCPPCIRSIPHNNEIWADYRNQNVVFIGVCTSNGTEDMGKVKRDESIKYPIAADRNSKTADAYGVDKYPTYCIIDQQGHIRFPDCRRKDVDDAIAFLLQEK